MNLDIVSFFDSGKNLIIASDINSSLSYKELLVKFGIQMKVNIIYFIMKSSTSIFFLIYVFFLNFYFFFKYMLFFKIKAFFFKFMLFIIYFLLFFFYYLVFFLIIFIFFLFFLFSFSILD